MIKRKINIALMGFLLLCVSETLLSAQKGLSRTDSIDVFSDNENYAVIVGINQYEFVGNLNYAVNDAERLSAFFKKQNYSVKTLIDYKASKTVLLERLKKVAELAGSKGGKTGNVVFAFSGHGFRHNGENYLGTHETDPGDVANTGVSLKQVAQILQAAEVRQRVLFIDACRNDPSKGSLSKSRTFTPDQTRDAEGLAILYSTRADSLSWEDNQIKQGVFSHFLLEGLQGGAAGNDGYVSFDELHHFVAGRVKRHVWDRFDKVQVPYVGGERTGQFVLAGGFPAQPARIEVAPSENNYGRLTVKVEPSNARVRIMNIGPKYEAGIKLKKGRSYDIYVQAEGYQSWRREIELKEDDQIVGVVLEKRSPVSSAVVEQSQWFEPEMVAIKGGRYRMGDLSGDGDSDEKPVHEVRIKPFLIGKYEVTFEEYDAFVRDTGVKRPSDKGWGRGNRPVINVSWNDALAYINWLNKKTGKKYRLPSESEWEYVARSGSTTKYSWGDEIGRNRANCDGCGSRWDNKQTAPVGRFRSNAWGVNDLHGNVWEWVEDIYQWSYKGAPRDGNAWVDSGESRVLRGGSWYLRPWNLRSANRNRFTAPYRSSSTGFRLAQDR